MPMLTTGLAAVAALRCRVTPMRARYEGNWSPQTSEFSGSFGNGDDFRWRGHGGPLQRPGMTGYPTIPHASAELPSGRELLKTGRPN